MNANVEDTAQHEPIEPESHKRRLEPFDPDSLEPETKKTRVTGKFIDKFWDKPESIVIEALDKILDLSLEKAIERYRTVPEKRFGAEKLLHKTWVSDYDPRSFKNRLRLTKLPKSTSMHSNSKVKAEENNYILNYDILNRRRAFLETCLSAELKQLQQLQSYYNSSKLNYESDANYLKEFGKTVAAHKIKMDQDIDRKRTELSIGVDNDKRPEIEFNIQNDSKIFTPKADDNIKELLESLNQNLCKLSANSKGALDFNERLDYFQSNLDMD